MSANMNMREITIGRFLRFIRDNVEDGDLTPIMGIGKSGIGKTEGVAELCKEMGIGFCELRLVTMTEIDLLGIPKIEQIKDEHGNVTEERTNYASNNLLPSVKRDGERGILVLDEITSATSNIRAAAYQLLDSKRALGNYKLPEKWLVVALGNGIEDGGVYQGMEGAFINRCKAFRVREDFATWKTWAVKHGANPSIISYLQIEPDNLHKFNADADVEMFPSPRSWMSLSKMINRRETANGGKAIDAESAELYACSAVGEMAGTAFGLFYSLNEGIVSADDIINGKVTTVQSLDMNAMIMISNQLVKKCRVIFDEHMDQDTLEPDKVAIKAIGNMMLFVSKINRNDLKIVVMREIFSGVPEAIQVASDDEYLDVPGIKEIRSIIEANSRLFGGV